jgi:hypothetical protein
MFTNKVMRLAITLACVVSTYSAGAQSEAVSGLYQVLSGRYSQCCGFAGGDLAHDLPTENQSFVSFTLDASGNVATMKFLAEDMQTVFRTIPCPPSGPIIFSFDHGLVFSNRTVFHVDPGGLPYQLYWNYTASNSANRLRIDGMVGTARSACADVPTRFSHSNVVAVLIPQPKLSVLEFSKDHAARIMVQGNAGWTDVIESSTDLAVWTPVSTNIMDFSLCPICPFIIFEDTASTNLARRFYRASEYR